MTCSKYRAFFRFFCATVFIAVQVEKVNCRERNVVVCTTLGKIQGMTVESSNNWVNQYLGIPYAKPPVSDLRFKKPIRVGPWSGTIRATTQPPACFQHSHDVYPWYDEQPGKSEDCLYLNVWTPSHASRQNNSAVMFWIHGGGFSVGSIRKEVYNGKSLAAVGDIVVVTAGYRMGSFGFLFSDTNDAPGNVGLWDILLALEWVHDHIGAFGGDPNRITIAGESAGAWAAGLLSVSPLSRGRYQRLILESGAPTYKMADDNTQSSTRSQKIAKALGCASETYTLQDYPEEVMQCMRRVPALNISIADSKHAGDTKEVLVPRFGDELFPVNPRQAIMAKQFQCRDLLIGNTLDEGSHSLAKREKDIFGAFGEKDPKINKSFAENLVREILIAFHEKDPEPIVKFYLNTSLCEDDYQTARYQAYTAIGDYVLLCPTVYYAEKCAEGNNVYFYFWTYRPSTSPWAKWTGVNHFSEVQFVFGSPLRNPSKYQPNEVEISKEIIGYWSEFVKNGKPSSSWPLYSKEKPEFFYLGSQGTGEGPHKQNCDFFRRKFSE